MTTAPQVKSCYTGLAERLNSKHKGELVKWKEVRKAEFEENFRLGQQIGLVFTWVGGDMGRYCLGACARGEVASLQPDISTLK